MRFIAQVNRWTHNLLGAVGRPIATATAASGATFGIGKLTGVAFISHPATVVTTGFVTAGVTEGVLIGFGRDAEVQSAEVARRTKKVKKAWDKLNVDTEQERIKKVQEILEGGFEGLFSFSSRDERDSKLEAVG